MRIRAFGWVSILVVVFMASFRGGLVARADDRLDTKRYVFSETHDDGGKTLFVIDEDPNLRDDPTVLSQKLVFKQRYPAARLAEFETAKASYENARPLGVSELRLPRKGRPLWTAVKDEWTAADEDAYSAWFAANVNTEFLRGTGLAADCADVGLTFRWVYARDHKLPIANTLSGSGKLFGNFTGSDAWDKLPTNADWRRDERFKAALRDLYDETFTWSINDDQYPTVISRKYVRPGSMYMIIRSYSGHTQTIQSLSDGNGIVTYWGNEPAAEDIYDSGLIVEFGNRKGFQNWRHVRRSVVNGKETWRLVPGSQMPGYSREQLETGLTSGSAWMNWIYAKLGLTLTDEQRYSVFAQTFLKSVDFRLSLTTAGSTHCNPSHPCDPAGTDYDNYSTFSRDSRLRDLRTDMETIADKLGESNSAVRVAKDSVEARGEIIKSSGLTYLDALEKESVMAGWSADPNVSFRARWGLRGLKARPSN